MAPNYWEHQPLLTYKISDKKHGRRSADICNFCHIFFSDWLSFILYHDGMKSRSVHELRDNTSTSHHQDYRSRTCRTGELHALDRFLCVLIQNYSLPIWLLSNGQTIEGYAFFYPGAYSSGRINISTRLFCWRPAGVSLLATG